MRKFLLFSIAILSAAFKAVTQKSIPPGYDSCVTFDFSGNTEKKLNKSIPEFSDGRIKKLTNYVWSELKKDWVPYPYDAVTDLVYDKMGKITTKIKWNIPFNYKTNKYDKNKMFPFSRETCLYNDKEQLTEFSYESRSEKKDNWGNGFKIIYEYEGDNLIRETMHDWMVTKVKKTATIKDQTTNDNYGIRMTTTTYEKGWKEIKDWVTRHTYTYKYGANDTIIASQSTLDYRIYDISLQAHQPSFRYEQETLYTTRQELMQKQRKRSGVDLQINGTVSYDNNKLIITNERGKRKEIYYYNHKFD